MTSGIDPYAVLAKYYDGAYAAMTDLIDGPFYVDLAQRIGGPVLEIGCGTGRVLLPIARAGTTIHGVDSSLPMLGILREKIETLFADAADVARALPCSAFFARRSSGNLRMCANGFAPITVTCAISASKRNIHW